MANGNQLQDYISRGSGAPGTPSLADNAADTAFYFRTSNKHLEVWDGSTWQDVSVADIVRLQDTFVSSTADAGGFKVAGPSFVEGPLYPADVSATGGISLAATGASVGLAAANTGAALGGVHLAPGAHTYALTAVDTNQNEVLCGTASVTVPSPAHPVVLTWTPADPFEPGVYGWNVYRDGEFLAGAGPNGSLTGTSNITFADTATPHTWTDDGSLTAKPALPYPARDTAPSLAITQNGLILPVPTAAPDPYFPRSASAWYTAAGLTPAAWTLPSGLTADYPPNGFGRLTDSADSTKRVAHAALTGSSPFEAIFRVRVPSALFGGFGTIWLGLGAAADGSDLSGFSLFGFGANSGLSNGSAISHASLGGAASGFWASWRVRMDGTTLTLLYSPDGKTFDPFASVANATVPAYALIVFNPAASAASVPTQLWLDYIALGNSTPAGQ